MTCYSFLSVCVIYQSRGESATLLTVCSQRRDEVPEGDQAAEQDNEDADGHGERFGGRRPGAAFVRGKGCHRTCPPHARLRDFTLPRSRHSRRVLHLTPLRQPDAAVPVWQTARLASTHWDEHADAIAQCTRQTHEASLRQMSLHLHCSLKGRGC